MRHKIYERIILTCNGKKNIIMMWTGYVWKMIELSSGPLGRRYLTFGIQERRRIPDDLGHC
jgi:hypothetical protein